MNRTKCIIIDDIPLAIASLQADIEDYCPELEVVGTAEGVVSGLKLLKEKETDLVFLDINLNDGSGFDLLDILDKKDLAVIFTTGSADYAIKAFQYAAVDYLLKPVAPELLKNAVEKAKKIMNMHPQLSLLKQYSRRSGTADKIAIHTQDKIQLINIHDIIRIEADSNYCFIHLHNEPKILVSKTLKEYENMLDPEAFIRVHQSHLIQIKWIKAYIKTDGGFLLMHDHSKIPVSVRKRSGVLELLKKMGDENHPPAEF